jgi:hypothetical protein
MRAPSPDRIAAALSALIISSAVLAVEEKQPEAAKGPSNDAYWHEVHSGEKVPEFHFVVTEKQWTDMHPERRSERSSRGGPPRERAGDSERQRSRPPGGLMGRGTKYTYVKAAMIVDGQRYDGIGLRFKGNSSFRFSGDSPRKPFKVDTNRYTKGLKLHGRSKLNFSNAFKDPTYLKEKLGYDVYHAAGLPTPRVGWARLYLTIEGKYKKKPLGLYVLVEQVDGKFIEKRIGKASKGSLLMKPEGLRDWVYLGDDPAKYDERYDIKEGKEHTKLILRFAELLRLIEEGTDEEFAKQIDERVDLQGVASYLAATALLSSLDSYVATPHNYYLLVDAADGKLKVLPWDINEVFATFTLGRSPTSLMKWSIERPWATKRRFLERLFEIEAFRSIYLAKVRLLLATSFTEEKLFSRLDALRKVVEPHLENDPFGGGIEGLVRGLEGGKGEPDRSRDESRSSGRSRRPGGRSIAIKPFIKGRIDSVKKQLAGETKGERFESRRRRSRPDRRRGERDD